MSEELKRVHLAAQEAAKERRIKFWREGLLGCFGEVKMPGEFGEPATTANVSIEQYATTTETYLPIEVFVADAEEAASYTPEEVRALAFRLLMMAEIAEALYEETST